MKVARASHTTQVIVAGYVKDPGNSSNMSTRTLAKGSVKVRLLNHFWEMGEEILDNPHVCVYITIYQYGWSSIRALGLVSYTSTVPENDTGKYCGPYGSAMAMVLRRQGGARVQTCLCRQMSIDGQSEKLKLDGPHLGTSPCLSGIWEIPKSRGPNVDPKE